MKIEFARINGEHREAWFSDDELYRFLLDIIWTPEAPILTVIGLNPSTATHLVDDPTIRRCKDFAKQWGFGGYRMLNAFAWRSTDPAGLHICKWPIGAENNLDFLRAMSPNLTIAAWGGNIQKKNWKHYYRGHDIAERFGEHLKCFRKTRDGHPAHPLYLPKDIHPIPFSY